MYMYIVHMLVYIIIFLWLIDFHLFAVTKETKSTLLTLTTILKNAKE